MLSRLLGRRQLAISTTDGRVTWIYTRSPQFFRRAAVTSGKGACIGSRYRYGRTRFQGRMCHEYHANDKHSDAAAGRHSGDDCAVPSRQNRRHGGDPGGCGGRGGGRENGGHAEQNGFEEFGG